MLLAVGDGVEGHGGRGRPRACVAAPALRVAKTGGGVGSPAARQDLDIAAFVAFVGGDEADGAVPIDPAPKLGPVVTSHSGFG